MAYPQTQVPNTQHTVFYVHTVTINGEEIGSFERFSSRGSRSHERIREVLAKRGPQVKEIVWGGTDISVDISRVELYDQNIFEAFGFEIYTLEDLNQPVDISEFQFNPGLDPTSDSPSRTITYVDCVASDWGKDLDTGTIRTVETMTFQCRTIIGFRS